MEIVNITQNRKKRIYFVTLVVFIISVSVLFYLYQYIIKSQRVDEISYEIKNGNAYSAYYLKEEPVSLQNLFVYDVAQGINDKYTKLNAHFIISRYSNNGGNIYEVYDYINNHKELSFLKEAETIYPETFSKIKEKALPATFTNDGLYATLAYYEILDKYGYANMAVLGTLSNQYAKFAYFEKIKKELVPNLYSSSVIERNAGKAIYFAKKTDTLLVSFMSDNNIQQKDLSDDPAKFLNINNKIFLKNVSGHDLLTGLTQYAASLRYLEAYGSIIPSTLNASTMFSIATNFSRSFIPEYLLSISVLNASTLSILNGGSDEDVSLALRPIIATGLIAGTKSYTLQKIFNAKNEKELYFSGTTIKNLNFDRYGKANITRLAQKVPDFKSWLILNGWLESDFETSQ